MLVRTVPVAVELEDARSRSEVEKPDEVDDEAEEDSDVEDEEVPVYGTVVGRVAEADMVVGEW
jgi:hypothetical protein